MPQAFYEKFTFIPDWRRRRYHAVRGHDPHLHGRSRDSTLTVEPRLCTPVPSTCGLSPRCCAQMVNFMDSKIGELVDALHTKAMWDDSILFFSADKCVGARPLYCRV